MLPVIVIMLLLAAVDVLFLDLGHFEHTYAETVSGDSTTTVTTTVETTNIAISLFYSTLFALAMIIPAILVSIKRWHDRDKSGWWMLILLVPYIGPLWLLIELGFLKGTAGPNRFGPPTAGDAGVLGDPQRASSPPLEQLAM